MPEVWMRDPFDKAQIIVLKKETTLVAALNAVLTKLNMPDKHPLIATPGSREVNIIGAKKEGICRLCAQPVWLSPSSKVRLQENGDNLVIVCLKCVEEAHDELSKKAGEGP